MHCSKCKKEGNNVRRCPDDPNNKENLFQPRKRKRKSTPKQTVDINQGDEDDGASRVDGAATVDGSSRVEHSNEDNLVDINLDFEEAPSIQTVFPVVASLEDISMFSQHTEQSSYEHQEPEKESEEHSGEDSEENDDHCKHQIGLKNPHGVKISYGPPPPSKTSKALNSDQGTSKPKKLEIKKRPSYCTRSESSFKPIFFGNDADPIDLE
ncbi:unnamed protein product [Cuscuta europaea]|uniref:Uncharacterized protein n=1 Tax=Cuscuta europaea TaxID=41803 RepID=A0A9P0Z0F0_CUSEU|nr:unnamed protein product [Cuscuta europaea]